MKALFFISALLAAATAIPNPPLLAPLSPLLQTSTEIPDEYIVVFKKDAIENEIQKHMSQVTNLLSLSNGHEHRVKHSYNIGSFRGYAAHMDTITLQEVRKMREVAYIERNQKVWIQGQCECQRRGSGSWGLGRTSSRVNNVTGSYCYDSSQQGDGVTVYVIDSGIEISHPEFEGRAIWGVDFTTSYSPKTDQNGHGTHVAGTIMSKSYGLAKNSTAVAVRVLNAMGRGTKDNVIAGINWVAKNHKQKSVVNLSLGGLASRVENDAVDALVVKGVHIAVAAGNDAFNACSYSPASAKKSFSVAASDRYDRFASFSNFGVCVDIIAPGVDILSTYLHGSIRTLSGTSMASPHIAGVMAKILTTSDPTPSQMKDLLWKSATKYQITDVPRNTPNLLLYNGCT